MRHYEYQDELITGLVSIKEASRILGVCNDTLREWDKNGDFVPTRTPGGHRRYRIEDLKKFQENGFKPEL